VAGESLIAIRLVAALCAALTVYLAGRLARELGGGRFAQVLACLAAMLAPIFLGVTRFYSMNAIELVLWAWAALLLVAILREGTPRRWLWLGVAMGLGLLNKISMMWFGLGLFAALILTPYRRRLLTPWPWAAAALALAIFAPHVWWQQAHGRPTLEFMRNAAGRKMVAVTVPSFVMTQFRVMGPANALVYLAGLLWALFARSGRAWRPLALLFLSVAALLIVAGTSRANYLAVAYPMLLALGGVAWERWTAGRKPLRVALVAIVTVLALPFVPLALPILPVETYVRYQAALGQKPSTEERKRVGPLPQHYADMFGWEELVTEVEKAYRRLSADEQHHAVVFGQNYGEAGAVDVLGRKRGLPPAISGHNQYWLWGPGNWDGRVIIIIGGDPDDNAAFFDSVERVGVIDSPYAMPYERGLDVSIGHGLKRSPSEVWPLLKHYD
jgi:4-amino-4-deoxy-L-arabinose transferase-like glycosyltransferase